MEWNPPDGMLPNVARAWREFFRKASSGAAGYTATPEDYITLYKAQRGRCFICQVARGIHPDDPKGRGSQRLGWDHNHTTGRVRGLLCTKGQWSCNRIVGRFRDRPEAFKRGASYLDCPPAFVLAQVEKLYPGMDLDQRIEFVSHFLGLGTPEPSLRPQSSLILDELSYVSINGQDVTPAISRIEIPISDDLSS